MSEEHQKLVIELNAADVAKRNTDNARNFLRRFPKVPGQFFMVKAIFLGHECSWHYHNVEAAFNDAADGCDAASITAPNGMTADYQPGMTLQQLEFIFSGNQAALSDGAL